MAPFRFSLQIDPADPDLDLDTIGPAAENAGFDLITTSDHVGANLNPMVALTHLAARTTTLRLGTMVLNNDMRNPVQLAWEAATLQRLSNGRFELGLGAGHTPHEYARTGITFDAPAARKRRLAEAIEIIAALHRGEAVTHDGDAYHLVDAQIGPALPSPPPLLVGGNGNALLTHAAAHADIIGLQGLGRTLADGHRHQVRFDPTRLDEQVATIRNVDTTNRVELQALIQVVTFTDDREAGLQQVVDRVDGLTMSDASATPFLAVGTVDEMANQLLAARDRWGLSYFTVRDIEFSQVMIRLREIESARAF